MTKNRPQTARNWEFKHVTKAKRNKIIELSTVSLVSDITRGIPTGPDLLYLINTDENCVNIHGLSELHTVTAHMVTIVSWHTFNVMSNSTLGCRVIILLNPHWLCLSSGLLVL